MLNPEFDDRDVTTLADGDSGSDGDGDGDPTTSVTDSPFNSFDHTGYFIRPDGAWLAKSWSDLVDGQIISAINRTENNQAIPFGDACAATSQVWTGTDINGDLNTPNCLNWYSMSSTNKGTFGLLHTTTSAWTDAAPMGCADPAPCDGARHLYCVEA
jgi:hypothetical protein